MAQQWTLLPDNSVRSPNGRRYNQDQIQDQIDDGRIELVAFDEKELKPRYILSVRSKINSYRERLIQSDFEALGYTFEADETSVRNMKEKLLEIAILDTSAAIVWIAKDDTPVQMTHDQFKEVLLAIGKRKEAAYLRANILKTGLSRLAINTLKNYDVASKW